MPVTDRLITAEEFERMPEEPGVRMELVRGHVIRMVAPGLPHSVIEPLVFSEGGVLDSGNVVPGFRCDIRRIVDADSQA